MSSVVGSMTMAKAITTVYPYNLLREVVGADPDDAESVREMLKYDISAFNESLTELSEREQKVLSLRFEQGLTYERVGKHLGVTRERIRQVEARGIRKLRSRRLRMLSQVVPLSDLLDAKKEIERLEIENRALKKMFKKAYKIFHITNIDVEEAAKEVAEEASAEANEPNLSVPIDELELSVRSYNCCKRAGYNTVGDFVGKTTEDLSHIRNLGRKSMDEVMSKLRGRGVVIEYV